MAPLTSKVLVSDFKNNNSNNNNGNKFSQKGK